MIGASNGSNENFPCIFFSLEETEDDQLDYRDFQKILGKGNEDLIDDIIQLVVADQFFQ